MAGLSLRAVTRTFGATRAVDRVDLEVADGEFLALLGPSGCGKTTLLRLLAGFERPDEGEIAFDDEVVSGPSLHLPPERRRLGMVFQSYALWPHMTVEGNVGYALRVRRVPRAERLRRVETALATVGLAGMGGRRPGELSGGQRQRVALARCLAAEPTLVLLDEPLANLDVHLRETMQQEFKTFHATTRATMVYVTHDQAEAIALADRIAVMQAGGIQQIGTPRELYVRPRTSFVAQFIGGGMVLPAETTAERAGPDGRLIVRILGVPAAVRHQGATTGRTVRVCVRAENLRLVDGRSEGLPAVVERTTYQGASTTVHLRVEGDDGVLLHLRVGGAVPAPGSRVTVAVDDAWVLPET